MEEKQRSPKGLKTVISGPPGQIFRKKTKKPFVLRASLNIIQSVAAEITPVRRFQPVAAAPSEEEQKDPAGLVKRPG
jgi:hypothetical protein